MAKRTLQISKIRLDGNTQPRVELDEALIAEYKEAYLNKAEMPPLEVMFDGASYWLWDGFHRRWGAERAGLDKLPCNVTEGTREDAQWASYGANKSHGLRRQNPDKQKAVKAALRHPNGPKYSDQEIAEHCGVDHKTVLKYRKELESSREIPKIDVRTVTRGGTTYQQDTTNIGSKLRKPAEPVEPDEPDELPEVEDEPENEILNDEPADDDEIDQDQPADLSAELEDDLAKTVEAYRDRGMKKAAIVNVMTGFLNALIDGKV